MENLNKVVKTYEKVELPTSNSNSYTYIKITVWIIISAIVIGSLIFKDNLLNEMSWTTKMILVSLAIGIGFWNTKKTLVASPLEIQFYDNFLVVFREKRYYNRKISRKEFNKFYYEDISKLEYNHITKRFDLIGKIDAMWFDYNKDGSVPKNPTYHRIVDGGICYFYIINNDEEDIISNMERYVGKMVLLR